MPHSPDLVSSGRSPSILSSELTLRSSGLPSNTSPPFVGLIYEAGSERAPPHINLVLHTHCGYRWGCWLGWQSASTAAAWEEWPVGEQSKGERRALLLGRVGGPGYQPP